MWLRIAERVGMSPQRAKFEHTLSDFMDWQAKFEEEDIGEPSKLDRQLARLTYYLYLVFMATVGKATDRNEDDFLVRYELVERDVNSAKAVPTNPPSDDDPPKPYNKEKVARSKMAWIAMGKASQVRKQDKRPRRGSGR